MELFTAIETTFCRYDINEIKKTPKSNQEILSDDNSNGKNCCSPSRRRWQGEIGTNQNRHRNHKKEKERYQKICELVPSEKIDDHGKLKHTPSAQKKKTQKQSMEDPLKTY